VAVLADKPTGTVNVVLDANGLPTYTIVEDVAWDHIPWSDAVAEVAACADAVCWGSLAQRAPGSRATIERFLDSVRPGALRICDINLRAETLDRDLIEGTLARAEVLKCNDEELPRIADLLGIPAGEDTERLRSLMARYEIAVAALTRGAEGSVLLRGDEVDVHPGYRVRVVDTVGAGDAFTAELAAGLLRGRPLADVHERANRRAAAVCACSGGTPELGPEPHVDDV
ncbi:MAG: PfkB family carbohydrate kinase, partial [Armatimonadota bacterium]